MKKIIGYVGVDSGQLIIADPCYLREWKDGRSDDTSCQYGKACEVTCTGEYAGEVLIAGIQGTGVAFATGGDGAFPIYAQFNEEGRITKIEIEL